MSVNLFQQPEYIHLLINHFPLTGLGVALLALLIAMAIRNRAAMLLSLGLASLLSASSWPVYEYGQKGYDRVYAMADDDGRIALKEHARLATKWIKFYYATAIIACLGLVIAWVWPKSLFPVSLVIVLLVGFCLIQGAQIAQEGGEIRHREFRP